MLLFELFEILVDLLILLNKNSVFFKKSINKSTSTRY